MRKPIGFGGGGWWPIRLVTAIILVSLMLTVRVDVALAVHQSGIDTSQTGEVQPGSEGSPTAQYVLRPWRALRSHQHNRLIHIPIGFGLSAFLLSVLALKKPELRPAISLLVLVAAVGSLAAFVSGTSQATAYDGSSKEWVVDLHRMFGIGSCVALWIWWIVLKTRSSARWTVLAGLAAVLLLTVAGFFGGIIAHG